jgi:hypothetical protein
VHALSAGFHHIRHHGLLANGAHTTNLALEQRAPLWRRAFD